MATEVILPQWGMNMEEGTLVRWLKHEGDEVAAGEPLVEIETAKINDQLESPTAGVLRHILVPDGQTVSVRTVLAIIAAPGEEVVRPGGAPIALTTSAPTGAVGPSEGLGAGSGRAESAGAALEAAPRTTTQIVPAARRLASELGVDLATVTGSGPGGRILEEDVR